MGGFIGRDELRGDHLVRPGQLFADHNERTDIYRVTDDVSDDQFEAAVTEAKAEGDLSRANVVRRPPWPCPGRLGVDGRCGSPLSSP